MDKKVATLLGKIERDLAELRSLMLADKPQNVRDVVVPVIPAIRSRYTAAQATRTKSQIDAAFAAGLITYDKKRGMKRSVTVATEGWSPVK